MMAVEPGAESWRGSRLSKENASPAWGVGLRRGGFGVLNLAVGIDFEEHVIGKDVLVAQSFACPIKPDRNAHGEPINLLGIAHLTGTLINVAAESRQPHIGEGVKEVGMQPQGVEVVGGDPSDALQVKPVSHPL